MTSGRADVVVIGGGVAGMAAALAASAGGRGVTLLTKESLDDSSTRYAQGGVAAALAFPDTPDLHKRDTMSAGAGHCDPDAVQVLVDEGPRRVAALLAGGARFDVEDGSLALAREGGHSMARILRAGGDATGAEIQRYMGEQVRASDVELVQDCRVTDLAVDAGRCAGVRTTDLDGMPGTIEARAVVLATGGAGALYEVTTNPDVATADGIAMAMRAGAITGDLEFVQFHPTALVVAERPRPLVSEAVRGEGAVLRRADGSSIMEGVHPMGDLAPRDVVAQAVFSAMAEAGADHIYLDATSIEGFTKRFPTITSLCADHGLDPRSDWLPVAPAAHYYCGGVITDLTGRSTVPGLYAIGEVACTGVHGANRLASNSLLEGLVFGGRVGDALASGDDGAQRAEGAARIAGEVIGATEDLATPGVAEGSPAPTAASIPALQRTMTRNAGVVRTQVSLDAARKELARIAGVTPPGRPPLENLLLAADALVVSAAMRRESRGCHVRGDFPTRDQIVSPLLTYPPARPHGSRGNWNFRICQRLRPDGVVEVLR